MSKTHDLLLLTDRRYVAPPELTPYVQNVLTEDRLVAEALERLGLRVGRVDWSDASVNWASTSAALFRSTWDYFNRFDEFQLWLERASALTTFINPVETIRWNYDKHYLADLATRGITIPPSIFLEAGDRRSLAEALQESGWEEIILKPCVSGGGKHTYRLHAGNVAEYEVLYQELVAKEAFMIQPLQQYVLDNGELSLIVIGGKYTHAVKKVAKAGDFRVQDDWGGTVHPYDPTEEEIAFAESAARAVSPLPAYARVDMIRDNDGALAVMELELIEPEMWFRLNPAAADSLAQVIAQGWFAALS
ncbi:MAG: hypothetical protein NWR72_07860 [Bacteroidia bacterium]|nr:hypothetical protein [Bacteroidia bacterium]